jgi:hypothetical protein
MTANEKFETRIYKKISDGGHRCFDSTHGLDGFQL